MREFVGAVSYTNFPPIFKPKSKEGETITKIENTQLLTRYLIKLYGSDQAKQILLENQNNLFGKNGPAVALGSRSIEFFCLYFLQDTFQVKSDNAARELAPFHYEIWKTLEDMFIKDSFDNLELVMPRGSSKTTTCDFALSVWAHCYKISTYTLVCGNTEQDAEQFIKTIRQALDENQYIVSAFGQLINSKRFTTNSKELEMANGTKIEAISSTSSMRGRKYGIHRPTLIIADDYQSSKDIITQEARDKKYKTWVEDCKYAGDKPVFRNNKKVKAGTKFIVLGTILHRDCFMSRLLKDNTYQHILKRAVNVEDIDSYFNSGLWAEFKRILFNSQDPYAVENAKEFYYSHEQEMQYKTLWPDKYNCLDLAINDYYPNPSAFKQELQNDASKIGEKAFHSITTKAADEIEQHDFEKTILCCDPAVGTTSKHDYTALLVGSKTSNNFRWVRKGIIERFTFDQYIDNVIELLITYEGISHVWIESNTFNGADSREIKQRIANDPSLRHRNIVVIAERQNKNKENKIRAIGGKVDSGFIIFNQNDSAFTDQIISYEGEGYSVHDDAPDVTAEFDRLIDELGIETTSKLTVLPFSFLFK